MMKLHRMTVLALLLTVGLGARGDDGYVLATPLPMDNLTSSACVPVAGGHTTPATEAQNASGLVLYEFPESSVGMIVSEKGGNLNIGEAISAPTELSGKEIAWDVLSTNLVAQDCGTGGYVFYTQSTNASERIVVARSGTFTIVWPYRENGELVTKAIDYETSVPNTVVPHRLFWTSAPFNAPGVALNKNYGVKLFGKSDLFLDESNTNEYGVVNMTKGVYYNRENNTCLAYAQEENGEWVGPRGEFVVAYYDSGACEHYLGCTVVEVSGPDPVYLTASVGDELRPQNENYDPSSGNYSPYIQSSQNETDDERAPYVYLQTAVSGQYHKKQNRVYGISETLPGETGAKKAEVYWEAADDFDVFWPFEETCYHLQWPDCPTVVLGRDGEPGPGLTIPSCYTPTLLDWREPADVASVSGTEVTLNNAGHFTLKLLNQANDDFWLVPLNVAYSDDPDAFPSAVAVNWPVGRELVPQAVRTLKDPLGQSVIRTLDLSLAGYLYENGSAGRNWNPELYHYDGAAAEGDFANLKSAIYFVNVKTATQYDAEVWWRRTYSCGDMPEALSFPVLPQRYKAIWPREREAQDIVLASGKGSGAGGLVSSGASLYLARASAHGEMTYSLGAHATGGASALLWVNPSPSAADAYDTTRTTGRVITVGIGQHELALTITEPSLDGAAAKARFALDTQGIDITLPADRWSCLAATLTTNALTFYADGGQLASFAISEWTPQSARECLVTVGAASTNEETCAAGVAVDGLRLWDVVPTGEQIAAVLTNENRVVEARAIVKMDFTESVTTSEGHLYLRDPQSQRYFYAQGVALVAPGRPVWTDGYLAAADGIAPRVYCENDPDATGYNPNEEHAIAIKEGDAGYSVYALRNDMNDDDHPPYVLATYSAGGKGAMKAYRALATSAFYGWPTLESEAGSKIAVFHPFDALPKGISTDSEVEVDDASNDRLPTHRDRTGIFWARRDGGFRHLIRYTGEPGFVCTAGSDSERDLEDLSLPLMSLDCAYEWPEAETPQLIAADDGTAAASASPLVAAGAMLLGSKNDAVTTNGTLTVDFDLKGGKDGTEEVVVVVTNGVCTLPAIVPPTKRNYTFEGYFEHVNDGDKWYNADGTPCKSVSFTATATYTLYASWKYKETPTRAEYSADMLLGTAPNPIAQVSHWPSLASARRMSVAQVLTKAEDGLPDVYDMKTCAVTYPFKGYSTNTVDGRIVKLIDPTRRHFATVQVDSDFPTEYGFTLGSEGNLVNRKGYYYFVGLPASLADRLFVDINSAGTGYADLVLVGDYHDSEAGVSYLRVNSLSASDYAAITNLFTTVREASATQEVKDKLDSLIAAARLIYDDGDYQPTRQTIVAGETNQVYYAADHYALVATGEGSGWVTVIENDGPGAESLPVTMYPIHVTNTLYCGKLVTLTDANNVLSEQLSVLYTAPLGRAADNFAFEWHYVDPPADGHTPTVPDSGSTDLGSDWAGGGQQTDGAYINVAKNANTGEVKLKDLVNRYWTMRYQATSGIVKATVPGWSNWCQPTLAEGWVQRVLNAITPFAQRLTDLYENKAELKYTMPEQIGAPWQGDVALNNENLASVGLEQLYRTVFNRAETLSIAQNGPMSEADDANASVNKQLVEAMARLADMWMTLGAEAYSDAQNPLIASSDGSEYSGAVFCFANQVPSLLDEELALLRGRSLTTATSSLAEYPCYNRLLWNFTKGVTQGEVAYVNNYNISAVDGVLDANAAAAMYPQGHGDAYGYYLSAVKGYYRLLRNPNFAWGEPSMMEMVIADNVVHMDYQEEDKFAECALNLAKIGAEVVSLTARKQWKEADDIRTAYLDSTNTCLSTSTSTSTSSLDLAQAFGYGQWAARAGYGAFVNWAVANALLPSDESTAVTHFRDASIATITRKTSTSLSPLASEIATIEEAVNSVDAGLNPLGLSENAIPFDISPADFCGSSTGQGRKSHYEQIRERAQTALDNAETVLAYANVYGSRLRAIENEEFDANADAEEMEASYDKQLIAIYGRPFADDIGAGKTYEEGYTGPDLYHYMYMDLSEYGLDEIPVYTNAIMIGSFDTDKMADYLGSTTNGNVTMTADDFRSLVDDGASSFNLNFSLTADGFVAMPTNWVGSRACEGSLQAAYRSFLTAYVAFKNAYDYYLYYDQKLDAVASLLALSQTRNSDLYTTLRSNYDEQKDMQKSIAAMNCASTALAWMADWSSKGFSFMTAGATDKIVGLANSVPVGSLLKSIWAGASGKMYLVTSSGKMAFDIISQGLSAAVTQDQLDMEIANLDYSTYTRYQSELTDMQSAYESRASAARSLQEALASLQSAMQNYRTVGEEGSSLLEERELVRTRQANNATQRRYLDMYARVARNTALSKFSTAFDVAQRYVFELAKVYDYETGLDVSDSASGKAFVDATIATRALGSEGLSVDDSVTDGGLWDLVNRMDANFAQLKGRLGIDNPDISSKWFSLRYSLFRIDPGERGDAAWRQLLKDHWVDDIRSNRYFARYCEPPQRAASVLAEPGFVFEFPTCVYAGQNFFGETLGGGETTYSSSDYAVKIYSVGVGFEGYDALVDAGTLAAEPNVYLVPVGKDYMRAPLAASRTVIDFTVIDQILPLPYSVGEDEVASTDWLATFDGLDGTVDSAAKIRRHSTLRADGNLSSTRLVSRSVWNDKWLLVIPAVELLGNVDVAKETFIGTGNGSDGVKDIKIGIQAYSRSGN